MDQHPYGVPLANQGFRVLDEALGDCPVWVAGELYVTGQGLADGYLGDPELTTARFFDHPVDGQRLYRTGDLGRYLPGGAIEFLGREDGQVKVRGHRIELGEVEAALLAHPAVGAAVAVVAGQARGDRALLAFVETGRRASPAPEATTDTSDRLISAVRRFAAEAVRDLPGERVGACVRELHQAALTSMLAALTEHGLFARPTDQHADEEILGTARVHERHHWLVRRWLGLLTEAGWLTGPEESGRYSRLRAADCAAALQAWTRVEEGTRAGLWTPEFVAYHRVHAERVQALLENRQNPFELLFPQGRYETAHALYRDDAIARYNNQAVAALMNRIAAGAAEGGRLRSSSSGPGPAPPARRSFRCWRATMSTTSFRISTPFFLAGARERFREHPWVRFGLVDLDRDYRAQGLAPNSADIVLCAGMLNSVRDLEAAVATTVELLAPGGWLEDARRGHGRAGRSHPDAAGRHDRPGEPRQGASATSPSSPTSAACRSRSAIAEARRCPGGPDAAGPAALREVGHVVLRCGRRLVLLRAAASTATSS